MQIFLNLLSNTEYPPSLKAPKHSPCFHQPSWKNTINVATECHHHVVKLNWRPHREEKMTILRLNGFHSLNVLPTKTKTHVLKCIRAPGSKITCRCMKDKVFGYQNLTASSGIFFLVWIHTRLLGFGLVFWFWIHTRLLQKWTAAEILSLFILSYFYEWFTHLSFLWRQYLVHPTWPYDHITSNNVDEIYMRCDISILPIVGLKQS